MPHQASKYSRYFYSGKNYSILKNDSRNFIKNKNNKNKKNEKSFVNTIKKIFKVFLFFAITFSILFALTMFLFKSSYFKIKNIVIDGIEKQDSYSRITQVINNQKKQTKLFWYQDNLFLFDINDFKDNLDKESNGYFYDIILKKAFPNKLLITVKERSTKIIVITPKKELLLDDNGNILSTKDNVKDIDIGYGEKKYKQEDMKDLPILYIEENLDIKDSILSKENILFIVNAFKKIPKYNLSIDRMKIETIDDNKLIIYESRGFEMYFNFLKDLDEQINYLNIVIKEEIKNNLGQIQYIDLRFIPRIFYK